MGYTKLFSSILASSIWQEDQATRLVWLTMLALKNERHVVEASISGLTNLSRVSRDECEAALTKFLAPDPESRNTAHEGRKIERVEGGWMILNGEHYRRLMSDDERKEYQKIKAREYRKRKKDVEDAAVKAGAQQAIKEGFGGK